MRDVLPLSEAIADHIERSLRGEPDGAENIVVRMDASLWRVVQRTLRAAPYPTPSPTKPEESGDWSDELPRDGETSAEAC